MRGLLDQVRTALTKLVAELRANTPGGSEPSRQAADQAMHFVVTGRRAKVNVTATQAGGGATATTMIGPGPPTTRGSGRLAGRSARRLWASLPSRPQSSPPSRSCELRVGNIATGVERGLLPDASHGYGDDSCGIWLVETRVLAASHHAGSHAPRADRTDAGHRAHDERHLHKGKMGSSGVRCALSFRYLR